jgi:flagella basal body P-ring formation protein FlgA
MKWIVKIFALELLIALTAAVAGHATNADLAVMNMVRSEYRLDTADYEIEVLSSQLKAEDVDADQLKVQALSQKEPVGLFTLLAWIEKDGEIVERGQVRLRIKKFSEVLVATDRIGRHDALSKDNLALARMEVTSLREQPVRSFDDLADQRAKRNLRKGQILTSPAIEPVPDIEVGREVTIVVSNDLLTITAPGKALQTGSTGDYVKVRNTATGKVLSAKVVDATSVAVDF